MRARRHFSRRSLLLGLPGLAVASAYGVKPVVAIAQVPRRDPRPTPVWGAGDLPPMEIDLPQLQYAGKWNPRPGAMRELGIELRLRTRLEPRREPSVVQTGDGSLFRTPFLYVAGLDGLPALGDEAEGQLRRFVDLGGMLVFDDASGGSDRAFFDEVGPLIARVLPGSRLARVDPEHVLYHSFYIVDAPVGRTRAAEHTLGVQEEGRLKVLVLPNDLGGALARNSEGQYLHGCSPGGAVQREWAIRFAVNILLYATCTDYKADRAHVETLLRSRHWR